MRRQLIVLALLAAPALAMAAPQLSEAAGGHPASSAGANAIAGQADAARIEACGQISRTFLEELEKGDFHAATGNFNGRMKAGLSEDKLGQVWQSLGHQFGKLESRGEPQTVMYQDMPVVSTPLHFEKGDFVSQLACDRDGKIAGFYVRPLPAAGAAPASSVQ
ncbi:MAG TPA: DUF3887 domain-containing protein [Rhodanobacteraceae bacterium]|nr:DUF3887 domain-containing protein [Rhodanobacteraceae bacterium]